MLTELDRDKMRQEDHDLLIRLETCAKGIVKEQHEQGEQIKDLYDRLTPISQWIGTANSGVKLLSYLGVVVIVVSLVWNVVGTGVTMLMRIVTQPQTQSHILLDPEAPEPEDQVRRPEGR